MGERLEERRVVLPSDLPFEFMLNALRLCDGFDVALYEARTGRSFEEIAHPLRQAQSRGLIEERESGAWVPTRLGRRFLNDLQGLFLPSA